MTPDATPPTPTQEANDLRIGVLVVWLTAVWALHLTGTQLHTGPGYGPLGVPAIIDWCSTHAIACTVMAVFVIVALATADPDPADVKPGSPT